MEETYLTSKHNLNHQKYVNNTHTHIYILLSDASSPMYYNTHTHTSSQMIHPCLGS